METRDCGPCVGCFGCRDVVGMVPLPSCMRLLFCDEISELLYQNLGV